MRVVPGMKGIEKKIKLKEKENFSIKMAIFLKENGLLDKNVEMEPTYAQME